MYSNDDTEFYFGGDNDNIVEQMEDRDIIYESMRECNEVLEN